MTEEEYKTLLLEKLNNGNKYHIQLDKEYYVAEWSRHPACNGNFVYKEKLRCKTNENGMNVYYTLGNSRSYLPYQICETKEEAEEVADFMNKFGYTHEDIRNEFLIENDIRATISGKERFDLIAKKAKEKGYFEW